LEDNSHLLERAKKLVLSDGIVSQSMSGFSGGPVLVAFALLLGASGLQLGLLACIPVFANLFQLFSVWFLNKIKSRRKVCVLFSFLGRFPLLILGFACLFSQGSWLIYLLIGVMFVHNFVGAISGGSWTSWMHDLIPSDQLGRFFSNRIRWAQGFAVAVSFLTGFVLDHFAGHEMMRFVFGCFFLVAGGLGLLSTFLLSQTHEPAMKEFPVFSFKELTRPFANENLRTLISFTILWNLASNFATPFFSVYLLSQLQYPVSIVIGLTVLAQLVTILSLGFWGKYSDTLNNKAVLRICVPLYMLSVLAWTYTTFPAKHLFTLPLLIIIHIMIGIANGGISLAVGNIGLKLAPKGKGSVFLISMNMSNSIFAGFGPLLSGMVSGYFTLKDLSIGFNYSGPDMKEAIHFISLQSWDFPFVFSVILGLLSFRILANLKEGLEIEKESLWGNLKSQLVGDLKNIPLFKQRKPLSLSKAKVYSALEKLDNDDNEELIYSSKADSSSSFS